jgi:hypothetical protein
MGLVGPVRRQKGCRRFPGDGRTFSRGPVPSRVRRLAFRPQASVENCARGGLLGWWGAPGDV